MRGGEKKNGGREGETDDEGSWWLLLHAGNGLRLAVVGRGGGAAMGGAWRRRSTRALEQGSGRRERDRDFAMMGAVNGEGGSRTARGGSVVDFHGWRRHDWRRQLQDGSGSSGHWWNGWIGRDWFWLDGVKSRRGWIPRGI